MSRRTPLSKRRLDAIIEALISRLAGPIESDDDDTSGSNDITRADYEKALDWAIDRSKK